MKQCIEGRLDSKKSLSITSTMVGLPLFGGVDMDTGITVSPDAFQKAFAPSQCLAVWQKVGAVSKDGRITRACLNDLQVLQEIGDNEDTNRLFYAVQNANDLSIGAHNTAGYDAQWLKVTLNEKNEEERVCVPYSPSRLELLANAR